MNQTNKVSVTSPKKTLTQLDETRLQSMADEGGAAAAQMEAENQVFPGENIKKASKNNVMLLSVATALIVGAAGYAVLRRWQK